MAACALVVAILLGLLLGRPLIYGASVEDVLRHGLYLGIYVALPGALLYRRFRAAGDDALLALGMGCALGYALQALGFVVLKLAGAEAWFPAWPAVAVALFAWNRVRPPRTESVAAEPRLAPIRPLHLLALLALVGVAVERTRLVHAADWWREQSPDLFFHAGNAADLLLRWPPLDPRVAVLGNNYHFFVYALPAGASQVCGFGVVDWFQRLGPAVLPALLALQVYNAGRVFGGSQAAGLIAAAIVVLHVDPMAGMEVLWPAHAGAFRFNSFLDNGIYRSLPTVGGLVLFATLAIAVRRWLLAQPGEATRHAVFAAILAAAASGIKGSVMPVVVASLALLALRNRRARAAFAVLALAAAPMTLYLVLGEGSRATSMLRPWLGEMSETSGFFRAAALALGVEPGVAPLGLRLALLPVWVIGYLGVAGVGGLLWASRARRPWSVPDAWIWLVLAVGLALTISLSACGHSQMFFVLSGQIGLALLSGSAIASLGFPRTPRAAAWTLLLLAFALPMTAGALRDVRLGLRRDRATRAEPPPLAAAYREGLDWIRDRSPRDAVFVVDHRWMLVSALGERRTFLETLLYTPEHVAARWRKDLWGLADGDPALPHADLRELQARIFAGDPRALEELLARLAPGAPVFVVRDDVRFVDTAGAGFRIELRAPRSDGDAAPPAFANEAISIRRIRGD